MLSRISIIAIVFVLGCTQIKNVQPGGGSLEREIAGDPFFVDSEDSDDAPIPLLEDFLPPFEKTNHRIAPNTSVYQNLEGLGMEALDILEMVKSTKSTFNLARVTGGTRFAVEKNLDDEIQRLTFHLSATQRLRIRRAPSGWRSKIVQMPTTVRMVHFRGLVESNLWGSAMQAGVPPSLFVEFADVFSWEVDFSREIRPGDQWSFTAEKIFVEGKAIGWGKIIKARYQNQGQNHRAYYFDNPKTGVAGYFDESGKSLRKMFLKSPLKFGRVTSGFNLRRFHPIKKVYRPHYGVDYGAPTGTPIHSIASGRVTKIGRFGGAGKMVTLSHPGNYKTNYLHMSRFASNLKVGSRVEQGQVIGYVGRTGSATGPHLHFELFKDGRYRDPLKLDMPPSKALAKELMGEFRSHIKTL